jgi:hypothetical protein
VGAGEGLAIGEDRQQQREGRGQVLEEAERRERQAPCRAREPEQGKRGEGSGREQEARELWRRAAQRTAGGLDGEREVADGERSERARFHHQGRDRANAGELVHQGPFVPTLTDGSDAWRLAGSPPYDGPPRRGQAWAGTDRQCRGRLMAVLRESEGTVPGSRLARTWDEADQRTRCLAGLVEDGLLVRSDAGYALP